MHPSLPSSAAAFQHKACLQQSSTVMALRSPRPCVADKPGSWIYWAVARVLGQSPARGAYSLLYAAAAPELDGKTTTASGTRKEYQALLDADTRALDCRGEDQLSVTCSPEPSATAQHAAGAAACLSCCCAHRPCLLQARAASISGLPTLAF